MRCEVLKCRENENGYCSCDSYVGIDKNGECNMMFIPSEDVTNIEEGEKC